jgi:hypothetical protein
MNWILLVTIFTVPHGWQTTGERFATESECQDAAFYAKGEARCINV